MRTRPFPWLCACLAFGAALALPAREPAADGRVHVVYWEKWVSFEGQAMQSVIDTFNHSQNKITVEYFGTSEIDHKTIVATAGGDPPDIAGIWAYNIPCYADAEALTPFDGFIRADGMTVPQWLARYYPIYARLCSHGGHVFAGISTPATIALYWNKTLFREAGLDPDRAPRTLAEFDADAQRLIRRDPHTGRLTQVGFLPQEPGWWPWIFCRWFGGRLFAGGKITLATDPANVAAFHWMQSFTQTIGVEDLKTFSSGVGAWASPEAAFFTGKIAMTFQGVWYDNYIHQYKPGLDYGVGTWPEAVAGITDFGMAEADVLVIPRGAKHPHEAWEFIKYVNSANPRARTFDELEGAERVDYLQQKNSPLKIWSPFFTDHNRQPNIAIFRRLSASSNTTATPDLGIWQEYNREFLAAFERMRLLECTPEEALNYAQDRLETSWERYRRSLVLHGQAAPEDVP